MVWNIAEFITLCVNRRGIHPGAHIAMDLLIGAGLVIAGTVDFIYPFGALGIGAGATEIIAAYVNGCLHASLSELDWVESYG
jgi:hypothetical protein